MSALLVVFPKTDEGPVDNKQAEQNPRRHLSVNQLLHRNRCLPFSCALYWSSALQKGKNEELRYSIGLEVITDVRARLTLFVAFEQGTHNRDVSW